MHEYIGDNYFSIGPVPNTGTSISLKASLDVKLRKASNKTIMLDLHTYFSGFN